MASMIAASLKSLLFLLVCRPGWSYVLPNELKVDGPLILTPYIEKGLLKEGREAAKVSPLLGSVASYSGFLTVDENKGKNMFFWYFPTENVQQYESETESETMGCVDGVCTFTYEREFRYQEVDDNAPVVLWLQGGPGVSSMYGLFYENGPYQLMENGSLELREYRWTKDFHMIYIDSPVGTGFSFADSDVYDHNESQVSMDLYQTLLQFFTLFPHLSDREFFIAGESYGGRYVPALGARIDSSNPTATLKINLAGLMIGDGVVDDEFMVYGDYLAQHGLIDLKELPTWKASENVYREALKRKDYQMANGIFQDFWYGIVATGVSVYNFLETKEPDFNDLTQFFDADVKQKIHVGSLTFNAENSVVNHLLWQGDFLSDVSSYTQPLLEKYRVMHYNGQLDIVCHFPMAAAYTNSLNWSRSNEFRNAEEIEWDVGEDLAGFVKSGGNLYLVMVRDAGHMVPHDQPKWAYDLVTKFVHNAL